MLEVNVVALTNLCHAACQNFAATGSGAVVNLSSAVAFFDPPGAATYAASKAYVLNLTYALDDAFQARGILFQCVVPGHTQLYRSALRVGRGTSLLRSLPASGR